MRIVPGGTRPRTRTSAGSCRSCRRPGSSVRHRCGGTAPSESPPGQRIPTQPRSAADMTLPSPPPTIGHTSAHPANSRLLPGGLGGPTPRHPGRIRLNPHRSRTPDLVGCSRTDLLGVSLQVPRDIRKDVHRSAARAICGPRTGPRREQGFYDERALSAVGDEPRSHRPWRAALAEPKCNGMEWGLTPDILGVDASPGAEQFFEDFGTPHVCGPVQRGLALGIGTIHRRACLDEQANGFRMVSVRCRHMQWSTRKAASRTRPRPGVEECFHVLNPHHCGVVQRAHTSIVTDVRVCPGPKAGFHHSGRPLKHQHFTPLSLSGEPTTMGSAVARKERGYACQDGSQASSTAGPEGHSSYPFGCSWCCCRRSWAPMPPGCRPRRSPVSEAAESI